MASVHVVGTQQHDDAGIGDGHDHRRAVVGRPSHVVGLVVAVEGIKRH